MHSEPISLPEPAPPPPAVRWEDGAVAVVDQRTLPDALRVLRLATVDAVVDAIRTLAVRGAPAIGLAGAYGVALAAFAPGATEISVATAAGRLAAVRPTAVHLARGVAGALAGFAAGGPQAALAAAEELAAQEGAANRAAAGHAARLLESLLPARPLRLLTHCHTGRLATGSFGTALGAISLLAARGRVAEVLVDETRPLLQGARLTAWELAGEGIPHRLCVDAAAASAMASGLVDAVLVGADRVAANGDTANKIGTYGLAVAAARHGIPFLVVAPESAWDRTLPDGSAIPVEERAPAEVTGFAGTRVAGPGTAAYNPAFDITPAMLVTALVTEHGAVPPAHSERLAGLGREMYAHGWLPGTSGNLSVRLPGGRALITASGRAKGEITAADTVVVDTVTSEPSHPVRPGGPRPSAETAIHTAVYRARPSAGAVVHAHSPYATALSMSAGADESPALLPIEGWELLKGLGLADPSRTRLPVLPNWSDVDRIAKAAAAHLAAVPDAPPGLLIAGHGVTAWGRDLGQARDRLECIEALCHLTLLTREPTCHRSLI
jgi:methylthioribose-1-phosphate isomerase